MAATAEPLGMVLQLGPALSVRGGVSSVERLIVEHVGSAVTIRHVATMEDGSLWRKLRVFVSAIGQLHSALRGGERLVVHIHFASRGSTLRKMLLAWMTLRARRPLILHAHGACFDEFFNGLPRPLQQRLGRTFARADCFVVLSTQWRDFYMRRCGLSSPRVTVLYNPTTLPEKVPTRAGRDCVQFLFLGRIGQRKGAFDLLQAFSELAPELRTRSRLVFAGDGDVDLLRGQARLLGDRVEVHMWMDRARCEELLERSDVFVLPSYQEGVPMAMLEAMAYGLPVITTAVGGIPDVVADQCEGLIVRPGDHAGLRAALRMLIEDEPKRLTLGRHARSRAQSFDVNRYSADLTRIYRRLLAGCR
jgi:glycosyltransferase involved in cell wall biosynthesis